ncbi:hypothetical protein EJ03DRAFT_131434 [Teratosphaeria nubilosa]|uniref:Uncharacterized protein n=1 Tax=Teratosphaeria nubilosa TaxID=161662 RepID=A0A6G1LKC7_9PEZI|nr:hypothetical protein EJ03DRAFT_131434 [Teratosphaeria nubilosa]
MASFGEEEWRNGICSHCCGGSFGACVRDSIDHDHPNPQARINTSRWAPGSAAASCTARLRVAGITSQAKMRRTLSFCNGDCAILCVWLVCRLAGQAESLF